MNAVKCLWADLVQYLQNNLTLPTLIPHAAILGILESFDLYSSYMCLSPEKKSS